MLHFVTEDFENYINKSAVHEIYWMIILYQKTWGEGGGERGGEGSKVIDYLKEMLLEDGSLGKIQKKVSNIMGLLSNLWWSLMS